MKTMGMVRVAAIAAFAAATVPGATRTAMSFCASSTASAGKRS